MEEPPDLVGLVLCKPDASIVWINRQVHWTTIRGRNYVLIKIEVGHIRHQVHPADSVPHKLCEPYESLAVIVRNTC